MSNDPLISILLVSHNAEKFILKTLSSCLSQTYKNIELLVLDNASTDTTLEILKKVKDPRLKIINSLVNIGPYKGLNLLLDQAAGDFIAIQDHDDLWLPKKLSKQLSWLSENPKAIGCGTQTYYYYEDRQLAVLSSPPEKTQFVDHTSLIFRKPSLCYKIGHPIPDEAFEADLQKYGELGCVQQPLTVHRLRADGYNLSINRTQGNFRAARAHWQLTKGRDFLGSLLFILGGLLPSKFIWWLRLHFTLKNSEWLTKEQFESKFGLSI